MKSTKITSRRLYCLALSAFVLLLLAGPTPAIRAQSEDAASPEGTPSEAPASPEGTPSEDSAPKAETQADEQTPAERRARERAEQASAAAAEGAEGAEGTETEKPSKKVPRIDYIERPGAPRERLSNFIRTEPLRAQPPSSTLEEQFNAMRRGRAPANTQVIDEVAKWHVYRMTQPGDEHNIGRKAQEILKIIEDAKTAQNEIVTGFRTAYKKAVVKYAQDLLENSMIVRVNAILLMTEMFNSDPPVSDPIPVFMELLKDTELEDPICYLTLRAIDRAKQRRLINVRQEQQIVRSILKQHSREDIQPLLLEQFTATLGRLGHAYSANIPEQVDVATHLANVALQPDNRPGGLRLRYVAALGLSNMDTRDIQGWNHELQALVLCVYYRDLLKAHLNGDIDRPEDVRFWCWQLSDALRKIATKPVNRTNPKFAELGSVLLGLVELAVEKRTVQLSDLEPLEEWIDSFEGIDKKLAPRGVELEVFGRDPQAGPNVDRIR